MTIASTRHEPSSVEELLARLRPRLGMLFARFRIPPQDAQDILQEALLAFVSKGSAVVSADSWLIGTVRNQCLLYWRRRRRRLYDTVDSTLLEMVASPERSPQERTDASRDLAAVMSHLPERCRSILKLRYGLGCEPPEVAERMGYRPSSIRKITLRCISALTRQMTACGLAREKGT